MKKIILSLAIVAVVATVAVSATRAYFSDTATISGNTITSGTLDLKVDQNILGSTQDWVDSFVSPLALNNLAPGYSQSQIIDIQKSGSVDGTASIRLVLTSNKENGSLFPEIAVGDSATLNGDLDGELAQNMRVKISYAADNVIFGPVLYDYTLAEFAANPNQLALGAMTGPSGVSSVKLEWYVPSDVGNIIMTDSVGVDVVFGLTQVTP